MVEINSAQILLDQKNASIRSALLLGWNLFYKEKLQADSTAIKVCFQSQWELKGFHACSRAFTTLAGSRAKGSNALATEHSLLISNISRAGNMYMNLCISRNTFLV